MSDLVIQAPSGAWVNICGSEWKILQEDGTWLIVDPLNDLRVRHGSNDYWMVIDCDTGGAYCPPENIAECWPGLTGDFDSSQFKTGGTTGYLVCDCNGNNCVTYTGHGPDYNLEGGRFFSTAPKMDNSVAYPLPATLYGGESEITETLVFAGERSGHIDISFLELDQQARVRIYHGCELLGDSDVSGVYFNVFYNAESPEMTELDCGEAKPANNFLTVRVDSPAGNRWRVKVGAANITQATNYERPAPCLGTYGPTLPCFIDDEQNFIPGEAVYEVLHKITTTGRVDIDLAVSGTEPLNFSVFYNGGLLATTTTANSLSNAFVATTLSFSFSPVGGDDFIVIRYSAPRSYNNWTYAIYCPDAKGSRLNPMLCTPVPDVVPLDVLCQPLNTSLNPLYAMIGAGAPVNDFHYDYSGKLYGDIVVEYFASDAVQFLFYQGSFPDETLVSGTQSTVVGHNRFYFRFDPSKGSSIRVRVVGPCCPEWAFTMSCPVPPAILDIRDAEIIRGKKGEVSYLCFDVVMRNKSPKRITFDWDTSPITALVSTDGTCTITEAVPDSPFCNIVSTHSVQVGNATNDTNIGWPQATRVASAAHNINCAVGGQYYVCETDILIPADGTYTMVGTADDNMVVYLDCAKIFVKSSTWEYSQSGTFEAKAGWQTLSFMYQNVPNCTPGWFKAIILGPGNSVVWASNATVGQWRSKAGAITVEPDPVPLVYGADYNQVHGSGAIESCTDSTQICVPICGTDLMGPDVTFAVTLKNVANAETGDLIGIGTIKNKNAYVCDQNTLVQVLDGGLDPFVNRDAHKMYVNKMVSNGGSSYVMDATITLPASGLYTFYFYGVDSATLYADCNLIAQCNGSSAVKTRVPMNAGPRKFYINYWLAASKTKRNGFASLAIVDSLNRIVYTSRAENWRGRVINSGTPPSCNQFPETCNVTPTGTVMTWPSFGNRGVGYGAKPINSTLHPPECAPGNTFYTMERKMTFPVTGSYTFRGIADDTLDIYIDCKHVHSGTLSAISQNNVTVTAGEHLVTIVYKNVPNCTPGFAIFVFLKPDGTVFYASDVQGWVSAVGSLGGRQPVGLYNSWLQGRLMTHISSVSYRGGPNYAWWSAERDITIPADGLYYVVGGADDALGVYIDCAGRPLNGQLFELSAGANKIQIRCYNEQSKRDNWFWFILYNQAGEIIYNSSADGWRGSWSDLDFSGLS